MHPLDQPLVEPPAAEREAFDRATAAYNAARDAYRAAVKAFHAANPRLVYAAYSRCRCGAGFAYLTTAGIHGSWQCSALLKLPPTADIVVERQNHDDDMPFAFWSVKSEIQPSANGATTRP